VTDTVQLSNDEARRIAVRAALLDAERPGDVVEVAEQLAIIKIDPTSVISTCENTMMWSRIGWSYESGQLQKAVEIDRLLFEYDGTFRPVSLLPLMLPRMRAMPLRDRTKEWLAANPTFKHEVLARLRGEGPLKASEIPDTAQVARHSDSGWYGPNQVPHMLEFLMRTGEVAVVRREGRTKVWDLAERVFPPDMPQYGEDEAARLYEGRRLQAAGLAKQKSPWSGAGTAGLAATVEGSSWKWRVDPIALAALDEDAGGRVAILNPYDTTLFDRPRLRELFDFDFVLEQFKPKDQRVYGFFAHPILVGDRFIGLLDAQIDRSENVLRVNALHELVPFDEDETEMVRAELFDLGEWLGMPVVGLR
jgi:uncharacterized protein YcaQ